MRGTRGTETSKYPEEKKTIVIPKVVASEIGTAQTSHIMWLGYGPQNGRRKDSQTYLERWGKAGDTPVDEILKPLAVSRVRRDTRNPDGRNGDHPRRLNTTM